MVLMVREGLLDVWGPAGNVSTMVPEPSPTGRLLRDASLHSASCSIGLPWPLQERGVGCLLLPGLASLGGLAGRCPA